MTPQQAIDLTQLLLTKLTWQRPSKLRADTSGIKFSYAGHDYYVTLEQGLPVTWEQTQLNKFDMATSHAVWLTGILNGRKRDDSGRHVA